MQFSWLIVSCAPVCHRYGDYPMLPKRSAHERDPWYQWDQPDIRHNWGEPVRMPAAVFMPLMLLSLNTNTCLLSAFFVILCPVASSSAGVCCLCTKQGQSIRSEFRLWSSD